MCLRVSGAVAPSAPPCIAAGSLSRSECQLVNFVCEKTLRQWYLEGRQQTLVYCGSSLIDLAIAAPLTASFL